MNSSPITRGGSAAAEGSGTQRRRFTSMVAALALLLGGAVAVAPFASAGTTPPFTIGPNGQAVVPGADADQNLPDLFGSIKELGPLNSNTTKIGVIHNDAVPTLGETNPNGQVDLRQAWIGSASDTDGARLALLRLGTRQQLRQRLHRLRVHAGRGACRL